MEKKNRKCILCPSHTYHYCGHCTNEKVRENWRNLFDSENCREVYNVLSEFAFGRLTANEAKSKLEKLDVPNKEDMQPALKKNLEEIYANVTIEKSIVPEPEPIKEPSIESYSTIEEPEEKITKTRRRRVFRRSFDD